MLEDACEIKIQSFYKATVFEIMTGTSVRAIKGVMKDFEEEEMYEECEGIKRAIEYCKGKTKEELEEEYYGK